MAYDDAAVRDGGRLHILLAPVGTSNPTLAMLDTFDPDTGTGNEAQTVTITGGPTGGTFTLDLDTEVTAGIAYNASASAVQSALEALPNVEPGDVAVTGGPLPGAPVVVSFRGQFAGQDVPLMVADDSGLTGGTTPDVAVATSAESWAPWTNLGHTDLDNDVETEEEGGDSEVRGSRQNPNLREKINPVTQFLTVNSIQIDPDTLALYFGDGSAASGVFATDGSFVAAERAALLVFIDGTILSAVHYPKASIRRAGAPTMDGGGFRRLPVRITPLKATGQPLQRWIDPALVTA